MLCCRKGVSGKPTQKLYKRCCHRISNRLQWSRSRYMACLSWWPMHVDIVYIEQQRGSLATEPLRTLLAEHAATAFRSQNCLPNYTIWHGRSFTAPTIYLFHEKARWHRLDDPFYYTYTIKQAFSATPIQVFVVTVHKDITRILSIILTCKHGLMPSQEGSWNFGFLVCLF